MIKGKKLLGLIPARSGSMRLPNKNILPIANKPLIGWTIEQALSSKSIDDVVVSTDSTEIAKIALGFGAEVPFLRPAYLSSESSKSIDVAIHALVEMSKLNREYDYIMLLQPTSPLRSSLDIDAASRLLADKNADAVLGVTYSENHHEWLVGVSKDHLITTFPKDTTFIRNDCDDMKKYQLNGSIYLCLTSRLIEENAFMFKTKSYAYIMDKNTSIDIDHKSDFERAELLLERITTKKKNYIQ